jgi:hypothetical protein
MDLCQLGSRCQAVPLKVRNRPWTETGREVLPLGSGAGWMLAMQSEVLCTASVGLVAPLGRLPRRAAQVVQVVGLK